MSAARRSSAAASVADDAALLAPLLEELARRGPSVVVPGLERVTTALDVMGDPHLAQPAVHVAGTNGKTSTVRMVDALLRGTGLRTGTYTSPHLQSLTERYLVDGEPIAAERLAAAFHDTEVALAAVDARAEHPVTHFELLTLLAFAAFSDVPVDVAVLEVGMGGRLDATNVVAAPVAVVTPVALDHPELGADVATVAGEKAAIIHQQATAVLAAQEPAAADVLLRRCADVGARPVREGVDFGVVERLPGVGGQQLALGGLGVTYNDVLLPLLGAYQAQNAACAVAAVESFLGGRALDPEVVREALATVTSPGRMEVVRRGPAVVLDVAHNPAGMRATVDAVQEAFAFDRSVGVLGVLADKDVEGVVAVLGEVVDLLVVTEPAGGRALPAEELGEVAADLLGEDRVVVVPRVADALDTALALAEEDVAGPGAGVLVTGSVVTVGEARSLLVPRPPG